MRVACNMAVQGGCYDTHHNDTQHNNTQHNDTQHTNTQHKDTTHNNTQQNNTLHDDNQHNDTQQYDNQLNNSQHYLQFSTLPGFCLSLKSLTGLKRLARDKYPSFFGLFVGKEEKKFSNINSGVLGI